MPLFGGVDGTPRTVARYLVDDERCVVATRRHWVVLVEPWLSALASFLLVAWLAFEVVDPRPGRLVDLLWWVWFAVVGRALWLTWDRQRTWFVATDRRLLLIYGLVIRRVAMMPLAKVTDMSYHRTPLGWLMGFGDFILESAGQDQALHRIRFVPRPDPTYRAIVDEIFHRDGEDGGYVDDRERDGVHMVEDADGRWVEVEDDPTSRLAMSSSTSRWQDMQVVQTYPPRGFRARVSRRKHRVASWLGLESPGEPMQRMSSRDSSRVDRRGGPPHER
ncbi:PH domain-containing protein [Austwickia chelonae]|uniref:PH domain-containing protein n=1 Tax=Austwickia chelonae TaxID=100225 RepID=UPI000E273CC3|nr:PH domain-containing protein [Austwickia chelonae]